MPKLIDKTAAYNALKHESETHGLSFSAEAYDRAARIIDQMPTIEAEPVRHGRWWRYPFKTASWRCDQCHHLADRQTQFCPNCGARMDATDTNVVKDIPAVNRWIPCSERLPEQDTMVIVCYYGSDCIFPMQGETVTEAIARQNKVPTVTMGFLDEEGWCGADFFPMMVQPTFWMNLPDAYEPPEKE